MKRKKRHKYRRNNKKNKAIIICSICALFLLTIGYSSFITNININVIGKTKARILITKKITNLKKNGDTTLIDDGTVDHNIRYSGKYVNNYVCLKNETPCSEENLYRIIGLFNNIKTTIDGESESRVKIIKNESIGTKMWNEVNENTWSTSTLASYLNNEYLNSLSPESKQLVDNTVWNITKLTFDNNTQTYYEKERMNSATASNVWTGKIGLYYPSDFGFATGGIKRSICLNATLYQFERTSFEGVYKDIDGCLTNNWLYNETETWFLNAGNNQTRVMFLHPSGYIDFGGVHSNPNVNLNVYPAMYLKSNVNIIENKNDGSKAKPYILE